MNSEELALWARDCRSEMSLDHENAVFVKFVILASYIGYKYAAYGLELPTSVAEPSFTFFANYADDWQQKFVERNPRHHGSRVAYGKRTRPTEEHEKKYFWQRSDFKREADMHDIIPEWVEQLSGLGGSVSFVALADRTKPACHGFNQQVRTLVDITTESMLRILLVKLLPQAHLKLTSAERAYLCWVLDGKTSGEIADIMAIPQPSVENMQRKLPERFEKKGITATAFLAYRLGLLTPHKEAN